MTKDLLTRTIDAIQSGELTPDRPDGISVGRVAGYLGVSDEMAEAVCEELASVVAEFRQKRKGEQ